MADAGIVWVSLFSGLDRSEPSLQRQIRHGIVAAVEQGRLLPGIRLPSSRALAQLLGVSRTTVVEAYDQLARDSYLVARARSGIFVAARPDSLVAGLAIPKAGVPQSEWRDRFAVRPSVFRHILKPHDWQDYPFPFLFGQLDPALFPRAEWRESVKAASSATGIGIWAGDMIDEDDPHLIEQLRMQVLPRRAIFAGEDEVMVTLGAQQALSLVTQLLVGADTPAGIEEPGYPDARHMMRLHTRRLRLLRVDADGLVPDGALRACRVAMVTPGHQCPTTATMPAARRIALLDAAREAGCVLVEDDYEAGLVLGDGIQPSLKSQDRDGQVIYVGSLSKALAPGLRIGFVVAPPAVIVELRALRRITLRHPPSNNQRAMASFIALGHYRAHLRRIGQVLAERAALLDVLLPRHLPGCGWRRDAGASSYWITGPAMLDARRVAACAATAGVLIEPGDVFFDDPAYGRNCFRLGFAAIPTARIEPGLRRLSAMIAADISAYS